VLALAQKDLKRMLAYSSISQAGYVLVGVEAASKSGTAGALFYLFTYTFIIIGTFAVVEVIQGVGEARNDLGAIRGLHRRQPLLALAMLVLLLAQAGVPFTSGFLAKFYVISAAVQRGQYPLAVIAMLAAAVAAFFYLRVALLMYGSEQGAEPAAAVPAGALPASPTPALPQAGTGDGPEPFGADLVPVTDGTLTAGLEPVPGLDWPAGTVASTGSSAVAVPAGAGTEVEAEAAAVTAALEAPPAERVKVPVLVGVALAICVVFTIVAGVSTPVITFARQATMLF
jgi:NADH:ubiquinone oxidoreductase subunit 5 (subunit L)/multisubunit Na+/H+ antiporter MnhA subunit